MRNAIAERDVSKSYKRRGRLGNDKIAGIKPLYRLIESDSVDLVSALIGRRAGADNGGD